MARAADPVDAEVLDLQSSPGDHRPNREREVS